MKKVFAILAVAGFMAACNSGENKEATADTAAAAPAVTTDTAAAHTDTAAAAAPAADTSKAAH
ncbi:MAG: hypothetical protein GXC72_14165 [Chitinophagaceae bacterium]|jgi:hypothetical protein|nr:hypothetical protein [Chitinophagaceae bacterium]